MSESENEKSENNVQKKKRPFKDISGSSSLKEVEPDSSRSDDCTVKKENDGKSEKVEDNIWDEELHRDFVSCVFDFGLKHCSPLLVSEKMKHSVKSASSPRGGDYYDENDYDKQNFNGLTLERIKSHLQKYRMNKKRSKNEFMNHYDAALETLQNVMCGKLLLSNANTNKYSTNPREKSDRIEKLMIHSLPNLLLPSTIDSLSSGDVAAYLSYTIMVTDKMKKEEQVSSKIFETDNHKEIKKNNYNEEHHEGTNQSNLIVKEDKNTHNGKIHNTKEISRSKLFSNLIEEEELKSQNTNLELPILTPEEKSSPIGIAFDFFVPLFHEVRRQIMLNRALYPSSKTDDRISSTLPIKTNHLHQATKPNTNTVPDNSSHLINSNQLHSPMNTKPQAVFRTTTQPSNSCCNIKINPPPLSHQTHLPTPLTTSFPSHYHANTNQHLPHNRHANYHLNNQKRMPSTSTIYRNNNNVNNKQVLYSYSQPPCHNTMNSKSNNYSHYYNTQVLENKQIPHTTVYHKNHFGPPPPLSHHQINNSGIHTSKQQLPQQQIITTSHPTIHKTHNINIHINDETKPFHTNGVLYSNPTTQQMIEPSNHDTFT